MAALIVSLLLPSAKKAEPRPDAQEQKAALTSTAKSAAPEAAHHPVQGLRTALADPCVLTWSVWWMLASCGSFQTQNYAQNLWEPMQEEGQSVANGLVECLNTLLSGC